MTSHERSQKQTPCIVHSLTKSSGKRLCKGGVLEHPLPIVPHKDVQRHVRSTSGAGRFQAVLSVREGASLFRVVETNDFNQLPHITLAFRPGNDAAVKAFLASRLAEVKAAHARLEAALCRTQVASRTLLQPAAALLHA